MRMKKLIDLIKKCYSNDIMRYLFFGGCTTLVNLVVFWVLRRLHVGLNIANFISIVIAVLFAYVVNARFVFLQKYSTLGEHVRPFLKFVGARCATMVIEMGGVWLLAEKMGLCDMIAKIATQVIVIILNYVFSKFLVFTDSGKTS